MTCESCKWFSRGATDGLMHQHLIALGGRMPSVSDIISYKRHNKDGICRLMPSPVQKYANDGCSQYEDRKAIEADE